MDDDDLKLRIGAAYGTLVVAALITIMIHDGTNNNGYGKWLWDGWSIGSLVVIAPVAIGLVGLLFVGIAMFVCWITTGEDLSDLVTNLRHTRKVKK